MFELNVVEQAEYRKRRCLDGDDRTSRCKDRVTFHRTRELRVRIRRSRVKFYRAIRSRLSIMCQHSKDGPAAWISTPDND